MKVVNYLSERKIGIEAPKSYERIFRNLQESLLEEGSADCKIKVEAGEKVEIVRDEKYPFSWSEENRDLPVKGTDFFRYGTKTKTIWEMPNSQFLVKSYLKGDEEGALKCIKKYYFGEPCSQDKVLLHASLVSISGEGCLIVGKYRAGKTTLTVRLLEDFGADLVSEGNTLISFTNGVLSGYYIPRPIYARFSIIADSEKLFPLIQDIDSCEATQPFDIDAIYRIIKARAFYVDAGLNISRQRFAELEQIRTLSSSEIRRVIFTYYLGEDPVQLVEVGSKGALKILKSCEFPKETSIGKVQKQTDILPPERTLINEEWLSSLRTLSISFNRNEDLSKQLLEDLLS